MEITTFKKARIQNELRYLASKTSQQKVAHKAGVSNATISQIINNKWELVSPEMFMAIEANLHLDFDWHSAKTQNYNIITQLLNYAKENSTSHAISEDAGRGKTHTFRQYTRHHNNVIHIECQNFWTKKTYVKAIMAASGLKQNGTLQEMVVRFIKHLKSQHYPLVIIDQFDKLKDPQLDLFMDFYNELNGYCGFILSGVRALEKRILNGVHREKIGYAELYSRINRKFIRLESLSKVDVRLICNANDVFDVDVVSYIYDCCQGDLRRVKTDVEIHQKKQIKEKILDFDVEHEVVEPPQEVPAIEEPIEA